MMNRDKLKKILIILFLIISIFTIEIIDVKAWGGSGTGGDGGSGTGGDGGGGGNSGTPSYGSQCDSVSCSYSYYWEKNTQAEVEISDLEGNRVSGDVFEQTVSKEFLAGTYVMLKVYEKQSFFSSATYSVSAKRQVWHCTYYENKAYSCCEYPLPNGQCGVSTCYKKEVVGEGDEDCGCSGGGMVEYSFKGWRDVTSEYVASCAAGAVPRSFDLEPIYIAEYKNSNDIKNTDVIQVEGHECPPSIKGTDDIGYGNGGYTGSNTLSGQCSVSYDRESDICINVINGNVRYLDGQTNGQCRENEYKVTKNQDGYWKYFIPLNANSANDFTFELKSSGTTEIKEICDDIKSKYSFWQNIIKMNPDGTCTYEAKATLPVIQRFYNELEDGETFKGFNFYYKPIDINEPFPNGLTDTSIWYEWNKDKNNPNISKSYEQLTYYANTSQNENEIRKYNNQKEYDNDKKDYPYASWEGKNENDTEGGMNKDGTSNFIDNKDIVTRRTEDFYNLGCGPKNTNVNNIFTQPECDR